MIHSCYSAYENRDLAAINTILSVKGTPRATAESFEEGLKYPKQIKRESPPIRTFEGAITKGKPYDGVTTIKEMGRSIHEIPRQDLLSQESRKTPEMVQTTRPIIEGSISQVHPESTVTLTQLQIQQ